MNEAMMNMLIKSIGIDPAKLKQLAEFVVGFINEVRPNVAELKRQNEENARELALVRASLARIETALVEKENANAG